MMNIHALRYGPTWKHTVCVAWIAALLSAAAPVWSQPQKPASAPQSTERSSGGEQSAPLVNTPPARNPISRPLTPEVADLTVTLDPLMPFIGYNENEAQMRIRLLNQSNESRAFRIEVGRLNLKNGNGFAKGSFQTNGGADWTEVALPANDSLSLAVVVKPLSYVGVYEGQIRVRPVGNLSTESTLTFQVTRQASAFAPSFKGAGIENNVFTMKPTSEERKTFIFSIENPSNSPEATVDMKLSAALSGDKGEAKIKSLSPDEPFLLLPGGTQTVAITFEDLPSSGVYHGRLSFSDSTGATRDLELNLQPAFVPDFDWWIVGSLVLVGALLSAIVGAAIPNLTTRRKLRVRFNDIQEAIDGITSTEVFSKAALLKKLHRAAGQATEVVSFTPSASDALREFSKVADDLEERSRLIAAVADQRKDVHASNSVPASARPALHRVLDDAASTIVSAPLADAKQKLITALQHIAASQTAGAIRAALDDAMRVLPLAPTPGNDPAMSARLIRLRTDYASLQANASTAQLLELDFQAQCARIYFNRYLGEILGARPGNQEYIDAGAGLVEALSRGQSEFMAAVALADSLQRGVTKLDVKAVLDDLSANARVVISPDEPRFGELVNFQLAFNKSAIGLSPLLQEIPIRWTFDGVSSDADGPRIGQYFKAPFRNHFKKGAGIQTVNYSVKVGNEPNQSISGSFNLTRRSAGGESGGKVEITSFAVTLLGSVALALLSKATDMRPLDTFQDYINPFLWGFGLDRMKSLINSRGDAPKPTAAQ